MTIAVWHFGWSDNLRLRVDANSNLVSPVINVAPIVERGKIAERNGGLIDNGTLPELQPSPFVQESLKKVALVFTDFEKKTSKVVYDKTFNNGKKIVISLVPPGVTEIEHASKKLAELCRDESDASVRGNLRTGGEKLMQDYGAFKRPIKVLHLWIPSDGSIPITFSEYFVDTVQAGIPADNGDFVVPVDSMSHDTAFGGSNSWFALRYSHLIEKVD